MGRKYVNDTDLYIQTYKNNKEGHSMLHMIRQSGVRSRQFVMQRGVLCAKPLSAHPGNLSSLSRAIISDFTGKGAAST